MTVAARGRLVVLEYHDITGVDGPDASGFPGPSAASYKLDASTFAGHLKTLAPMGPMRMKCDGTSMPADGKLLLTFDDGGMDALRVAAPLMEEAGIRGVFFVTTGMIGSPGFLGADDIRELVRRGHAVGTHSVTHPGRFSALPAVRMAEELRASRATLENVLGAEVRIGSLPGGYFSRQVAEVAAEEGYRWLFTSEPTTRLSEHRGCAVAGRFTLRRGDDALRAAEFATGRGWARFQARAKWGVLKGIKLVAGPAYLPVRRALFRDDRAPSALPKGQE